VDLVGLAPCAISGQHRQQRRDGHQRTVLVHEAIDHRSARLSRGFRGRSYPHRVPAPTLEFPLTCRNRGSSSAAIHSPTLHMVLGRWRLQAGDGPSALPRLGVVDDAEKPPT
jgi:hypothetical protein